MFVEWGGDGTNALTQETTGGKQINQRKAHAVAHIHLCVFKTVALSLGRTSESAGHPQTIASASLGEGPQHRWVLKLPM